MQLVFLKAEMLAEQNQNTPKPEERRAMRRFDMRLAAAVSFPDASDNSERAQSDVLTETQNVSARGVFFYLDRPIVQGTRIEVTTTFPPHITLTDSLRVRFKARVVRVEAPSPVSRIGVAALIEEYEFLGAAMELDPLSVQ
jgi:PilZ domain-containing protein